VILTLTPRALSPGYGLADIHRGGLVMFAGGDLIMGALATVLAVAFVRAQERPRADLDAYNAYLAALSSGGSR
jgi:hypothetical protein